MDPQSQTPTNSQSEPIKVQPSPFITDNNNRKKIGPIIVIFIIGIAVIVLAVVLFTSKSNPQPEQSAELSPTEQSVPTISGTSDDIQSIQEDLDNSTTGVDDQDF